MNKKPISKPVLVPLGGRQFLTRNELAARWGVTPVTVSRRYKQLGLRPIRVIGRLLFELDEVEAVEQGSAEIA